MTKKDFELIAHALNSARPALRPDNTSAAMAEQARWTAIVVANALRASNPRFDRGRFLKACGVSE